jgi:excisionase family DNA binding protein
LSALPNQLLTAEQVAKRLQVKPSWVYRAAREGTIPAVRLGRWVRFDPDALDRWLGGEYDPADRSRNGGGTVDAARPPAQEN